MRLCSYLILFFSLSLQAETLNWERLLHFENGKSLADGEGFFFAKDGRINFQSEYEATHQAFKENRQNVGQHKTPAACAFPARYKFFKSIDPTLPTPICQELDVWLKGINAKSATLIFASSYPNNPASLFGHTFLRLNQGDEKKDLLDYAINYAATTAGDGGITFAFLGVFGGYEGHFSLAPYFLKVKEYNHIEGRDLFEYDLNLTLDEIDTLLRHLWELENNNYFRYYFFDENCSYMLLRLIEVARPTLHLTSHSGKIAIPWEAIKIAHENKIISNSFERPSLITRLSEKGDAKTIDDELDYLFALKSNKGELSSNLAARERELLLKRSTLPENISVNPRRKIKEERSPLNIHKISKATLGYRNRVKRNEETLSYRLGVHSSLDPQDGNIPYANLEFFKFDIYRDLEKIHFERFTLLDILSHSEFDKNNFSPSYKMKLAFANPNKIETKMGLGSTAIHSKKFTMAYFINSEISLTKDTQRGYLSPEIELYSGFKSLVCSFKSSYHFMPERFVYELRFEKSLNSLTIGIATILENLRRSPLTPFTGDLHLSLFF